MKSVCTWFAFIGGAAGLLAACLIPANGAYGGGGGYGGATYGGGPAAVVVSPSDVDVSAPGCRCGGNTTIVVMCTVTNNASVAVNVDLKAKAETGTFGVNSRGKSSTVIGAGDSRVVEVVTDFDAMMDCSSCKSAQCSVTDISAM